MQKMFIPNADHYDFLNKCVDAEPEHTLIATFGIYAGITYDGRDSTEWGSEWGLNTRNLITKLQELDNVQFLVGVTNYRSCKGKIPCIDCEKQYVRSLFRLVFHAEKFPEFEWRITTDLHLKCSLFFYDRDCTPSKAKGVAGGRNFTDSSWADVTFELSAKQIEELHNYTAELWSESLSATDDSVSSIFEKQGISSKGIEAVLDKVAKD